MSIKELPWKTINFIKSSQVISSISSIVKELIENSLDAGATAISVHLENNGYKKIEVKDNGIGIKEQDIPFVAKPHHTSKISFIEDLNHLTSYGFRGEALSSLCNVSKLSITTKTEQKKVGACYHFDNNGNITDCKPTTIANGTLISVEGLFHNVPVRRQYFSNSKRQEAEFQKIERLTMAFALINPGLHITLIHNKSIIFRKSFTSEIKHSASVIFKDAYSKLVFRESTSNDFSFRLWLPTSCDLSCTSSSNDKLFLSVNNRPITDKDMEKMVKKYFNERVEYTNNRYPVGLILLDVPCDTIDVNLDPNKTRVFFKEKEMILKGLDSLLREIYCNNERDSLQDKGVLALSSKLHLKERLGSQKSKFHSPNVLRDSKRSHIKNSQSKNYPKSQQTLNNFVSCSTHPSEKNLDHNSNEIFLASKDDCRYVSTCMSPAAAFNVPNIPRSNESSFKFEPRISVEMDPSQKENVNYVPSGLNNLSNGMRNGERISNSDLNVNNSTSSSVNDTTILPTNDSFDLFNSSLKVVKSKEDNFHKKNINFESSRLSNVTDRIMNGSGTDNFTDRISNGSGTGLIINNNERMQSSASETIIISPENHSFELSKTLPRGVDLKIGDSHAEYINYAPSRLRNCADGMNNDTGSDLTTSKYQRTINSANGTVALSPNHSFELFKPSPIDVAFENNKSSENSLLKKIDMISWATGNIIQNGSNIQSVSIAGPSKRVASPFSANKCSPENRRDVANAKKCKLSPGHSVNDSRNGSTFGKPDSPFSLFVREYKKKVFEETPDADSAFVANELVKRWNATDLLTKQKYEQSIRLSRTSDVLEHRKSHVWDESQRKCLQLDFDINSLRHSSIKQLRTKENELTLLGHLRGMNGWVIRLGSEICGLNDSRLNELVLFNTSLASSSVPVCELQAPISLSSSVLGSEAWTTLLRLNRQLSPSEEEYLITDPRIMSNGFEITVMGSSCNNDDIETGNIVGLSEKYDSFDVKNLVEILTKIHQNPSLSLRESRPKALSNWFKICAIEMSRSSPHIVKSSILFDKIRLLLESLHDENILNLKCLHGLPVFSSIASIL